jgi:GntR family transcriptional regulator
LVQPAIPDTDLKESVVLKNGKSKKLPLYIQIGELLHREIAAGHWQPGERLPIESQLATSLNVAVGTLRKALAKLEADGLLERRQGSGTYVKRAPTGTAIYQFFHLELLGGGGVPRADTLAVSMRQEPEVAQQLEMDYLEAKLWSIRRKRYLNTQLVAAEEIWIDYRHSDSLVAEDLHESLYMHYREVFGFWIGRVEDRIDCVEAPDWVAELLAVEAGSTLVRVERKGWSNNNQVEEFSRTWFDPLKCRYFARWS